MDLASFLLSALGLVLVILGVYLPGWEKFFERLAQFFLDRKALPVPSFELKRWLRNWYVLLPSYFIAKFVADALLLELGINIYAFLAFLAALPLTFFVIQALFCLLYFFNYISRFCFWFLYLAFRFFVWLSRASNKDAKILTGSGVLIAVIGTFLSGYVLFT